MITLFTALVFQQGTAALDTTFARWRAESPAPAVAMAVVHKGRIVYTNVAGYAELEHRVPATLETRFDWASIAKQFTAFAVSLLVEEGTVSPSDPVQKHVPDLDLEGATITIEQLIHHTAGLEDADGLMLLAGGLPGDRVTTADVVRVMLGQRHLRFPPGESHAYGNGGYALLTEVIARVSGKPFEKFADSAIFKPLGLGSASFAGPTDLVPARAMPYVMKRGWQVSSVDSYFGAGGLVATVGDMAKWTMHLMQPGFQPSATRRLRERGHLTSGDTIQYAWGIGSGRHRGLTTLAHSGSGPATSAQVTMYPDQEFAVAVAAAGDLAPDVNTLARRAAETFLAKELGPVTAPKGPQMVMLSEESFREAPAESRNVVVAFERLNVYAGTYKFPGGQSMVIRTQGNGLEFAFNGRAPYFPLHPLPDGRFVMVPLWEAYRFIADASGKVTAMARERTPQSMRNTGDSITVATRVMLPVLDAKAAAPYVGTYYSDELRAFYEVTYIGGVLVLRHARHGMMELRPLGDDEFALESRAVTRAKFGRAGTAVVGMELTAFSWDARASFRRLE